jgi:hypothetical protein
MRGTDHHRGRHLSDYSVRHARLQKAMISADRAAHSHALGYGRHGEGARESGSTAGRRMTPNEKRAGRWLELVHSF